MLQKIRSSAARFAGMCHKAGTAHQHWDERRMRYILERIY